jgi:hypothetical protein
MSYIVQVILYTGLFWALYSGFAKDKVRPGVARVYLLLSAMVPIVLPFVCWDLNEASGSRTFQKPLPPSSTLIESGPLGAELTPPIHYVTYYWVVSACLALFLLLRGLYFLRRLRGMEYHHHEGFRVYRNSGIGPASFWRAIFLPAGEAPTEILNHEVAHLRASHSSDLILIGIVRCVFWPNVFLRVIARELRVVHEYSADEAAAAGCPDYVAVLLQSIRVKAHPGILHSFSSHPLKRRIQMLTNGPKTPVRPARLLTVAAALLTFGVVMLQSCSKKEELNNEGQIMREILSMVSYTQAHPGFKGKAMINGREVSVNEDSMIGKDGRVFYHTVTQKAVPSSELRKMLRKDLPGWELDYLTDSTHRPFQIALVTVNKDGSISDVDASFDNDPQIGGKLSYVLSHSPKWKPANVDGRPVVTQALMGLSRIGN